jgi:hypothetical protein
MRLGGDSRPVAACSRERGERDRGRPQDGPGRTDGPDLLCELGDHDCELQGARHPLCVELVGGGQRKERLEEVSGCERGAEVPIQRASSSPSFQNLCGVFAGMEIEVPGVSLLWTPSTSKTSEPEISSAPLSWQGWTCSGSRSSVRG